jgi:uncharacterized protein (TIGR02466 family)
MMTGKNHFATPIFQDDIADFVDQNEKLCALVKRLQAEDPKGVQRSNQGGWHSAETPDVRELAEFADLKKVIMDAAKTVAGGLGFEGRSMFLASAWFVVSPAGAANVRHVHPQTFLSGAYYIKAPEGSSPICFHDPRLTKVYATPMSTNPQGTPYTAETVKYQVEERRLIIFPGWLEHSVPAHQASGERIVLSFNFVAF